MALAKIQKLSKALEQASSQLAMAPSRIESLTSRLADQVNTHGDAIVSAADILARTTDNVLLQQVEALDDHLDAFNETAESALQQAEELLPYTVAGDTIEQSTQHATDYYAETEQSLDAVIDEIADQREEALAKVVEINDMIIEVANTYREQVTKYVDDNLNLFAESFLAPLQETVQATIERLDATANEMIETTLQEETTKIEHQIAEALEELLGQLAIKLRNLIAQLHESMCADDEEGRSKRELASDAVDALEQAIGPLEAALEAFSDLASMVGVRI